MSEPQHSVDPSWKQYIDASAQRVERMERRLKADPLRTLAEATAETAELLKAIRIASATIPRDE